MRYIIAFFLPPLAVLLCGKPGQAFFNLLLCCLFWIPGVIHAFVVVGSHKADKRNEKLIKAIQRNNS
ncbi:hemolysin BL lytic component L2 [Paenibacillus jamilae]|uniref:Hemolysin BL lytic component L2 n=1 Tax=Paenibacillus jamilae TaxID=114136 RepID=A0ACC5A0Q8_9BACL|nr:YqaE/Pmp3 family membrane protein [Paenibacillus jamilae]KTS84470.1 hemolysin BL lytic component L2 [Paenibacillus jamilae]